MRASWSIIRACSGISSQMRTPVRLVAIGLKGPRYSSGASGLRAHEPMWRGRAPGTTQLHEVVGGGSGAVIGTQQVGEGQTGQAQGAGAEEAAAADAVAVA